MARNTFLLHLSSVGMKDLGEMRTFKIKDPSWYWRTVP